MKKIYVTITQEIYRQKIFLFLMRYIACTLISLHVVGGYKRLLKHTNTNLNWMVILKQSNVVLLPWAFSYVKNNFFILCLFFHFDSYFYQAFLFSPSLMIDLRGFCMIHSDSIYFQCHFIVLPKNVVIIVLEN